MTMACGILVLNCESYVALKLAYWTQEFWPWSWPQDPGLGLGLGLGLVLGLWILALTTTLLHRSIGLGWVEILGPPIDGLGWIGSHKMDPWTTLY